MSWLTYDTKLSFKHKLPDEEWVKDKACLTIHHHFESPIHVEMEAITGKPFDFKNLNQVVETVLDKYRNEDITTKYEITTCESFTRALHKEISNKLKNTLQISNVNLIVHIQETPKYGVTEK